MAGLRGKALGGALLLACGCAPVTDPNAGGKDAGSEPPSTHRLEVERRGTGAGLVSSVPGGIDCGDQCEAEFDDGASVTLTAQPASGSSFTGWAGACQGRGECVVQMDADQSVAAVFEDSVSPGWANSYGSDFSDVFEDIVVDAEGDLVTTGFFRGSITFGNIPLTSISSPEGNQSQDVFVAKFDADGRPLWAVAIQGPGHDRPGGLAVDAQGDVYVAGSFQFELNNANCSSAGGNDVFHLKLRGDDGELVWSNCYGGSSRDQVDDIAIDAGGTLWVAHSFLGTTSFASDATEPLVSAGEDDIVLSRYTTDAGEHLKSDQYGGAGDDQLLDLAPAPNGGVYAAGAVIGDVVFAGQPISSRGDYDAAIVRFGPSGEVVWARGWGGAGRDYAYRLTTAASGDVLVSAVFADGAPGSASFGGIDFSNQDDIGDLVLAKYEHSRGDHVWSRAFAATASALISSLDLDGSGNAIAAGSFAEGIDFGGGTLGGWTGFSGFVANFGAEDGAHLWSVSYGDANNEANLNAARYSPSAGAIFAGGGFRGALSIGEDTLATETDEHDALLMRLPP